ncbi:hypothetical protein CRG98_037991 [Punica granatum]|uniref:HAT C-terminal dimerisation domain-containing protein n=1 Tax=Punica granatum TaxID=22663 RepID=A0A2I0IC74_PUNGR|nr:hypothetical protein CRG98_037991 [Punica granatum]
MLKTSHPCEWWAYCGHDVPILMKYAIRILSQPCSGSAFKQSLSVFQSSHNEKQKRSALGASYDQRSPRMNMILTARFTARDASDKPIDLTQLGRLNLSDMSFSNDLLNEAGVPRLDIQPTQRSDLAAEQCPSWKFLQLQFVTQISSFQVTGQEVKGEQGYQIHVFLVDSTTDTREPDAAAHLTQVPENSQMMMTGNMDDMARPWSPLQNIADGETELYSQFFGSMWNAEAEYKHKRKDNVKSRQAAVRWLKLKAILQWAILRRMVVRKRAQKMSVRTQVPKQLEEYSDEDLNRRVEEFIWRFQLQMQELSKDKWKNNEKPLLLEPPQEVELESAPCPNSSIGNSRTFPKPNTLESRQPLTLFPSLLAGKDMEPMEIEDKVRELLKPIARLSTSPTKVNEASLEKMNQRGVSSCRSCHHLNLQRSEMCRCGDSSSGAGLCYGSLGRRGNGSSFGCFKCGVVKDDSPGGGSDCEVPLNTSESRRPLTLFPSLLDGSDGEPSEDEGDSGVSSDTQFDPEALVEEFIHHTMFPDDKAREFLKPATSLSTSPTKVNKASLDLSQKGSFQRRGSVLPPRRGQVKAIFFEKLRSTLKRYIMGYKIP